jgi:Mn-dependent DtxR family transcriptional regulator
MFSRLTRQPSFSVGIAQRLGISFPNHVYALCEDLETMGLVVRATRFIVLTEQGKEFCKSKKKG